MQLRQSIPFGWRIMLRNEKVVYDPNTTVKITIKDNKRDILNTRSKDFYWLLIEKLNAAPNCKKKWESTFNQLHNENTEVWQRIYKLPYKLTHETKLQSFQYRLINRIIPCNKWLNDIRIKNADTCSFCSEKDDLIHFFLECEMVQIFWNSLLNWWNQTTGAIFIKNVEYRENILFGAAGNDDTTSVFNYIVLNAKYYIYIQKIVNDNNIFFLQFLINLRNKLHIKKDICKKDSKAQNFDKYKPIYEALCD